jgi:CRP-like cAMP-binding protein
MLRSDEPFQSDARRLTDGLRASSEHSRRYVRNGNVEQRALTINIILDGGVLRQRVLSNGKVQTVAVYFRDDVIDLCLYANGKPKERDYLLALQGSVIGSVPYNVMAGLESATSGKADGVSVLMAREIGIAHEHLTSLGQRSSIQAMAHFFCEAFLRCVGPKPMTDRRSFPITQTTLSTVLGISSVHINRTLQELRRRNLADVVDQHLVVHDYKGLAALADFDDAYLVAI